MLQLFFVVTLSQPSTVETESEEYRSHNSTESDIEVQAQGVVVIEDVSTVRYHRDSQSFAELHVKMERSE